jgi:hypothetical protein
MKRTLLLAFVLLFTGMVYAADLSDYPSLFISKGLLDVVFIVGDHANIADAIGAVDVATSLQFYTDNKVASSAMLASEVESLNSSNMIVIGGPCANPIAAQLLGYPNNCMEGFTRGRAIVRLFDNGNTVSMVIAGATAADTRRACRAVANFNDFKDQFKGSAIQVTGTSLTDISISR